MIIIMPSIMQMQRSTSSKLSHLKHDATVMCMHISKGALTDSMMLEMRTSIRSTNSHFETQVLQHDAGNAHQHQKAKEQEHAYRETQV